MQPLLERLPLGLSADLPGARLEAFLPADAATAELLSVEARGRERRPERRGGEPSRKPPS